MTPGLVIVLTFAAVCQVETRQPSSTETKKHAGSSLHALYLADAAEYKIYRDVQKEEMLELRRQPVYAWTNPTRDGGQTGDVFVWTYRGRPEAVGSIFSHPMAGRRRVIHEFHSLCPVILFPEGNPRTRWQPKSGAVLKAVPGAPKAAESRPQRLLQMKSLAREFSAYSITPANGDRWELRLQTTPLLQYDAAGPDVLGGALFTFVTTAGTDPEVMLLIEARKTDQGWRWMFTPARFSDYSLYLLHKNRQVWAAVRGPMDTLQSDAQQLYNGRIDRFIPEIERDR
ncbi:MAG: hypothetical protein HQ582_09905 [Planctomycetes bacterium]|nr:hypothetical protein [Planctomycetota bacterium]